MNILELFMVKKAGLYRYSNLQLLELGKFKCLLSYLHDFIKKNK